MTLNSTVWPVNSPSSVKLPRKVYEHLLAGLAQQAFERSAARAKQHNRCSKLALIAFGSSDKVFDREDSMNQMSTLALSIYPSITRTILPPPPQRPCVFFANPTRFSVFAKGRQIDALGRETPTAVQMGWCLRKFVDAGSRSDVLDFALRRSVKPPVRDEEESEDSD